MAQISHTRRHRNSRLEFAPLPKKTLDKHNIPFQNESAFKDGTWGLSRGNKFCNRSLGYDKTPNNSEERFDECFRQEVRQKRYRKPF